jgi:N-acetylmuramoyl-L-alanine amidase
MYQYIRHYISHPQPRPFLRDALRFRLRKVAAIVCHWTANTAIGADAKAHRKWLQGGAVGPKGMPQSVSAHYFVDDRAVVHTIPDNEVAFHCGDRPKGRYMPEGANMIMEYNKNNPADKVWTPNFLTLGYEICVNQDGDWGMAEQNSIELAAELLFRHGLETKNLIRHYDVTGKACPKMYLSESDWDSYKEWVGVELNEIRDTFFRAVVSSKELNVRAGRGANHEVLYRLQYGEFVALDRLQAGDWCEIQPGQFVNSKFLLII